MISTVKNSSYSKIIETDPMKGNFWMKHIIGGALFTVAMTGLDQNMMQKNLSMKSLKDARKNMIWFSFVMVIVNVLFLSLGVLLYHYAQVKGIALPVNEKGIATDNVFPLMALGHFGAFTALAFIVGLTAATFSSADSVLATLTTSFCIDFLNFGESSKYSQKRQNNIRHAIHIGFALVLLLVIVLIKIFFSSQASIDIILMMATLTYGPLIGLFAAGLFTKMNFRDKWIPIICAISPIICYLLIKKDEISFMAPFASLLHGYKFGNEIIFVNGLLTFIFLLLLKTKKPTTI